MFIALIPLADPPQTFGGVRRGTFPPGAQSYLQTMFIVSRFSSLSGCLNPKLRRFAPGLYPLYRGLFIPAGRPVRHSAARFVLQLAVAGRPYRASRSQPSRRSRHSSTPCFVVLEKSLTSPLSSERTFF